MILRHFPKPCPPPGWPNLVIHARGRAIEYPEHAGPLSLKCVFEGEEIHDVAGVRYVVDDRSVLLLNHGRSYSSHIRPGREVEIFSLFFERDFATGTLRSLTQSVEDLRDDPTPTDCEPVEFFETRYSLNRDLALLLRTMRDQTETWKDAPLWLEERLHEVLAHLLLQYADSVRESQSLSAVRPVTRAEQYRRVLRARDFIEGNLRAGADLSTIASVSCLSSFHLLRLFKQAFRETPHQYLTRRRLEHAHDLLTTTDLPVWNICQRVGYESLSSFSNLVSRRYGASPLALRRQLTTR